MTVEFKLPEVLQDKANLIGGVHCNAKSGKTFDLISPVTGEVLAKIPLCDKGDVDAAVAAAKTAWEPYKLTPIFKRAELMLRIAELIRENAETIAMLKTFEMGKSYEHESMPCALETAKNFQLAGEDIVRMETPIIPMEDPDKRVFTQREGVGVMAVITPWNFPTTIPSEYLGPGLAAGNSIVIKPASTTPLSMIMVGFLIQQALDEFDMPKGTFNLITGPGSTVGDYLVSHEDVDMIGFTGETVTGQSICSRAGIKKTLMELGGNGPQIVCEDANLKEAAIAAATGCFYNSGQVCCATERILVHEKVHDKFVEYMLEEVRNWELGNPAESGDYKIGPLNNEATAVKTETHLKDAVAKGAKILSGGERASGYPTKLYFPATVIDGVTEEMLLNKEETFGPVAPIITFKDDDEAVKIANGTGYGLQMAVFTSSIKKAFFYAEKLRTGNLVVNDTTDYWEAHEPFGGGGGTKSGYGRLGGRYTLEDVTSFKTIAIDIKKTL